MDGRYYYLVQALRLLGTGTNARMEDKLVPPKLITVRCTIVGLPVSAERLPHSGRLSYGLSISHLNGRALSAGAGATIP